MSAVPGKVVVRGTAEIRGEKVFVLEFLQARDPSWVHRPFFAQFDANATWLDQLKPAFGDTSFFFENGNSPSTNDASLISAANLVRTTSKTLPN